MACTVMNRALSNLAEELNPSNTSGIKKKTFKRTCPYNVDKRRDVYYHYCQVYDKWPPQPLVATDTVDAHTKLFWALNNRTRLSWSKKEKHANDDVS